MNIKSYTQQKPSAVVSVCLFLAMVGFMAWLRLVVFRDELVTLTYGLPLLVCFWHRDKRLLWGMSLGFVVISAIKSFVVLPAYRDGSVNFLQWSFQLLNIGIIAGAIHTVLVLMDRLHLRNQQLQTANEEIARQNEELKAQSEELAQQNEELQQQGEELAQQNEELQRQSEELEQQSEELAAQSEELLGTNAELNQREAMLQKVLGSLRADQTEEQMTRNICDTLVTLLGGSAVAATLVARNGGVLPLCMHSGPVQDHNGAANLDGSFSGLIVRENRTAFVDDLDARKDLKIPTTADGQFRSAIGTPLRLFGSPCGALCAFALQPRQWTEREFRILEWVAVQCSLVLETARLRERLRDSHQRLENSNNVLEKVVEERTAQLQEMVNELEHFSYTITHDMRAPLRAMLGFASLMAETCGDQIKPETQDCIDRIISSARRMDRLITDALRYSRAVKEELQVDVVDTRKLLEGIIQSYPDFQPPRANIIIQGDLPKVLGNEAGLTQCFSNLVGNAVKFVAPGKVPCVRISAEQRDSLVRLWFEDDGIGIAPQMLPRIFQMFQRGSRDYEGTGIGLALVRKVAERMGGRVGVEPKSPSRPGSRFWLDLTAAPSESMIAGPIAQTKSSDK